jgi:hypothetical protein
MLSVFNYKIFIQKIFTISLIIANKMKNKAKFNNLETVPKSNTKINCKNKAPSSKSRLLNYISRCYFCHERSSSHP